MQARPASNSSPPDRWGIAIGNLEDAKVSLATLAHALEDAVYLDEDAFTQMQPVAQFQRTTQASRQPGSCLSAILSRGGSSHSHSGDICFHKILQHAWAPLPACATCRLPQSSSGNHHM